jgi:hypothetical protein
MRLTRPHLPRPRAPLFQPSARGVAYPVGTSRPKTSTSSCCCFLSLHLPRPAAGAGGRRGRAGVLPPPPKQSAYATPVKQEEEKPKLGTADSSSRRRGSHPCTLYLFGCAKDESRPSIVPQRERLADSSVDDLNPPCSNLGRISHGCGSPSRPASY